MQIQPIEPVTVLIGSTDCKITGQLVSLNNDTLTIVSREFLDKGNSVLFKSKYFRGEALVSSVSYNQHEFTYSLEITEIRFQPGLLVNTQL